MQKYFFLIFLSTVISFSCNKRMAKAHKLSIAKSDRLVKRLFEQNKNVFYLRASYSKYASFWTYEASNLVVYTVKGLRIVKRREYKHDGNLDWLESFKKEDLEELTSQCMVLDGIVLDVVIDLNGEKLERVGILDEKCMEPELYSSSLVKRVFEDIKKYKI